VLHGRRFHLIDSMHLGDLPAVDADLAACGELAAALRQPYYEWYVEYLRCMRALLGGRIAEADRLCESARVIGQRAESRNVLHLYGGQILWIRREQGRMSELEPMMRQLVEQFPAIAWRGALAHVLLESGKLDEARAQFEVVASHAFGDLPRDAFWMLSMGSMADTCAALGADAHAGLLYDLLAPHAHRVYEGSLGAVCLGSVEAPLGRLAAVLRRWDQADRHFEAALAVHLRLGAQHLAAHVRRSQGEMLLARAAPRDAVRARDLLMHAAATYQHLGMERHFARCAPLIEQTYAARRRAAQKTSDRIRLVR